MTFVGSHGENFTAIAAQLVDHLTKRATASTIFVECRRTNIMGNLVQTAAPFLFPCTIEYSLICAVILFEMWKHICSDKKHNYLEPIIHKDSHQLSINCAGSNRGMFGGILVLVFTLISLIMYFVLRQEKPYLSTAVIEVNACESIIYLITAAAVIMAMIKMRRLRFSSKRKGMF